VLSATSNTVCICIIVLSLFLLLQLDRVLRPVLEPVRVGRRSPQLIRARRESTGAARRPWHVRALTEGGELYGYPADSAT